ncbi:TonB-dependent receptor [Pontibacter sp. G13]|uniref:SusC/RagA family TonB-linked outer membrane protein n=1 Tax=Pontibacter sp. G13 TaxID=3074898 RepID=UPI00288996A3|nr:TonB-dependent receptor [Pontibacter sp. G13]WNJ20452.1 TonB-dependent receptor [Pontibacter sp. G13]
MNHLSRQLLHVPTKECIWMFILILGTAMTLSAQAPTRLIQGVVYSQEADQPLSGVSIRVKETTRGTYTDEKGEFQLQVSEADILVVSYIGFAPKDVPVGAQDLIEITLSPQVESVDEVVIVGYGQQKRSNLTGAITSVNTENLENRPIVRVDQALQGMASGVMVSKGGGAPGGAPTIHIRGVGSIGNTQPLWIVDGMKMSPGNHFNLDDIESIEILKDAASSAIYGAEAAHGVILITTKRGKAGRTDITYRSSFAKVSPIRLPELLGSEDFVRFKRESRINAGQNPEPAWDNWEHDTDWLGAYYGGSGFSHYHDFSIAKGTEKSSYFLSLGYDDEAGILIDNSFQRLSLRFNSDFELADWLKIGERVLISRVSENPIDNFNENYSGAIPYRSLPIMPIYDETNPYGGWGRAPVYFQGPNPVASQMQRHEKRAYNRIDGNLFAEANPLKGLMIRARVGYNFMTYLGNAFSEGFDYGAFANPINSLTYSTAQDETIIANMVATYERQLGNHFFRGMVGYEASQFQSTHFNATATDFPVEVASSFNLATGTFNVTDRNSVYQKRLLSQFARINYNFKEKYLFEANVRRDASAPKFSPENIWGIFPSFSAAWRISEERFLEPVDWLSNLKLRASWGTLGSDKIGDFIYSKTYTSRFASYAFDANGQDRVAGFYLSRFPNAEVKWEEVQMTNVGLDAEFWKGTLAFSMDFYIKDTKDLLYGVPIPYSVGISTHNFNPIIPEVNVGTMRNMGLDLDLRYRKQFGKTKLSIGANTSFLKNEILKLNAEEYITGGSGGGQIGGMTRTQAGMPISSFYGFKVQQILNSESDVFAINTFAADGIYQEAGTGPGDLMYQDLSGPDGVPDGEITWEHDRTFIGNPWPKMMYGLNVNLDFGGKMDLLLQFQGLQGVDVFNANLAYTRNFFGDANTTTDIYEAWTVENPTRHPRNIASDPNGNFSRPSTYFMEDGSYFRLRNAQIGFNVPKNWLERIGKVRSIRFYAHANNLFTLTKYSGFDPEIAGSNLSRGVDFGQYPATRTIGGGLDINL